MSLKRLVVVLFLGVLFAGGISSINAQTLEDRNYRISFKSGQSSITIREDIVGSERVIYRFSARAGQTIDFRLSSDTRLVEFRMYSPGTFPNGRPVASSTIAGALVPDLNRYEGKAPTTGDYRIVLRHVRELSSSGLESSFRLNLSITGSGDTDEAATQLPGDALVGEPAYWRVSGLKVGDKLNMRAGPGTSFRVVDQLAQGEIVKNEGCAAAAGAQWCEVSRPGRPRESGWVSARYLVASSPPKPGAGQGATQLPGKPENPKFNATGNLTCLVANRVRQCPFGVVRYGRGNATLYVDLPSGSQRRIEFEGGVPMSSNAAGGVYAEYTGTGAALVFIGTTERFTVEEAVLFGG